MEIGLTLPQLGGNVTRDGLRGFCEQAEELGFGSLWVQEHCSTTRSGVGLLGAAGAQGSRSVPQRAGALETLTAAAAWTTRPWFGTSILVAGLTARYARAATRDHRPAVRGSGDRGFLRGVVGRGASGHGRRPAHPRRALRRAHRRVGRLLGSGPGLVLGPLLRDPRGGGQAQAASSPAAAVGHAIDGRAATDRRKVRHLEPGVGHARTAPRDFRAVRPMRPAGMAPLELYRRLFTVPPVEVANLRTASVDELCDGGRPLARVRRRLDGHHRHQLRRRLDSHAEVGRRAERARAAAGGGP